ncbi:hypothetical protein EJ110_NYTH08690 [Nymphaea thermarum]|nr:hypothetical protein EJ110_NYTH08690 [Nymphaea thermarum]
MIVSSPTPTAEGRRLLRLRGGCSGEQLPLIYTAMFQAFDQGRSGAIDKAKFKAEMKRMLLGMADGLGALPIQMVLKDDSFLKLAADLESSAF